MTWDGTERRQRPRLPRSAIAMPAVGDDCDRCGAPVPTGVTRCAICRQAPPEPIKGVLPRVWEAIVARTGRRWGAA